MKDGRIAGNDSINAAIYRCFDLISEADAKAYAKKFAEQPHDQDQVKHTLRELIVGTFLISLLFTSISMPPLTQSNFTLPSLIKMQVLLQLIIM